MFESTWPVLWLTLSFLFACPWGWIDSAFGQTDSDPTDLKQLLQDRLDKTCIENNLPALWAGKISQDASLFCVSGIRKFGETEKAELTDVIHLGSCTKAMTAVLIAQLCSEDKIQPSSSLKEIFSHVPEVVDSGWANVTVQELLQHRSGAPANLDYHAFDRHHPDSVVDARRAILLSLAKRRHPSKPTFVYSNIGYIVLGHVIETLEKKPWETVIAERLFQPLDMRSAAFGPVGLPDALPVGSSILKDRAWGHVESVSVAGLAQSLLSGKSAAPKLEPRQIDNSRCLGPAGRVHMNMQDWSKFVRIFAVPEGYQALHIKPEVWQELLKPAPEAKEHELYAAGWIIVDNPELGQGLFHNGSNTTWYCYAFAVQSRNCCVLVATNVYSEAARRECDAVARFMLEQK